MRKLHLEQILPILLVNCDFESVIPDGILEIAFLESCGHISAKKVSEICSAALHRDKEVSQRFLHSVLEQRLLGELEREVALRVLWQVSVITVSDLFAAVSWCQACFATRSNLPAGK